jgi:hypothetical protein
MLSAYVLKSPLGTRILAALIGVTAGPPAKIEAALQAPSILSAVVFLVGLRLQRFLGRLTSRLVPRRRQPIEPEAKPEADAATEGRALVDASGSVEPPAAPGLNLPKPADDGSFPKVIFQTWKSKISIPFNYAHWSESFRRINPDFEYFLWDDFDNRGFIKEYYPWFLPVYDAYPREIYRADAVRYFFLYQFGGLYVDMDTECLKPLAPFFRSGDVWLGRMGTDPDFAHSVPNAIMASRPRQEFWLLAIHFLVENARAQDGPDGMIARGPEVLTGPILLKTAYDTYVASERSTVQAMIRGIAARLPENLQPQAKVSEIVLLDPDIWYPIDWSNVIHFRLLSEITSSQLMLGHAAKQWLFPTASLVTYWTHSWKAPVRE